MTEERQPRSEGWSIPAPAGETVLPDPPGNAERPRDTDAPPEADGHREGPEAGWRDTVDAFPPFPVAGLGGTEAVDGDHPPVTGDSGAPKAGLPWSHMSAAAKEFVVVVAMALGLSLIVKTWLMQAFYIPSGSMEDTLVLNDRVVVSKLTPRVFELHRGDIVVFADPGSWLGPRPATNRSPVADALAEALTFVGLLPDNSEDHLIKRVIGLPGDHVVCCDSEKRLTINGTAVHETYLKPGNESSATPFDITVPTGRVWVMGDHRSDSSDSRYHDPGGTGALGSVPISLITGRAVALVWPLNHIEGLGTPDEVFAAVPPPSSASAARTSSPVLLASPGGH
jgi:signal peptidase I